MDEGFAVLSCPFEFNLYCPLVFRFTVTDEGTTSLGGFLSSLCLLLILRDRAILTILLEMTKTLQSALAAAHTDSQLGPSAFTICLWEPLLPEFLALLLVC